MPRDFQRAKRESPRLSLHVYLPAPLRREIDEQAIVLNLNMTAYIRQALEHWIEHCRLRVEAKRAHDARLEAAAVARRQAAAAARR